MQASSIKLMTSKIIGLFRVTISFSKLIGRSLIVLAALVSFACSRDEAATRSYPAIDTHSVTGISGNGATFNAEILNLGVAGIIDHGFVYGEFPPSLNLSNRISLGAITQKGSFSVMATQNLINGKRYYVRAYAITQNQSFIVYGQQVEFLSEGGALPQILDFTPKEGSIGDTVILRGSGFNTILNGNKVFIGPFSSTVIKATSDSIWCVVPTATAAGANDLTLIFGELTIKAPTSFILKEIMLNSVSPEWISFEDTVTIGAENLPKSNSQIAVTILGSGASILSHSAHEIKVLVSDNAVLLQQPVIIKVGSQTKQSVDVLKLKPPSITSVVPNEGKGGSLVTIFGNNFNLIRDKQTVKFGDLIVEIIDVRKTYLTVKLPTGLTDKLVSLVVQVSGQEVTATDPFHLLSPWRRVADCPTGLYLGTGWSACGYGYVASGVYNGSQVWRYDPSGDVWDPAASYPYVSSYDLFQQASFAIGCNGFVGFGGTNQGVPVTNVYKYSAAGNSWNQISYVQELKYGSVGWSLNGNGYITFGSQGYLNSASPATWKYVDASDTRTRVADFPATPPIRSSPTGFESGVKGYLVTGFNQDFWEYDAVSDVWTQLPDFPGTARSGSSSFAINSYGYVFGGSKEYLGVSGSYDYRKEVWQYDISQKNWLRLEDFPGEAREFAVAFVIGNKAYYGTGTGTVNSILSDFWEFDPSKL